MSGDLIAVIIVGIFLLMVFLPFFYQKNRDRTFKSIASKSHRNLSLHQKENYLKGFGLGDIVPIRTLTGNMGDKDIVIQDVFKMTPKDLSRRSKVPRFLLVESFWQRYFFFFPGSCGGTLMFVNGTKQDISNYQFLSLSAFAKPSQIRALLDPFIVK